MSSILRTTAQIDSRVKFLLTVATTDLFSPPSESSVKSVMTETEFSNLMTINSVAAGFLFRDLGKAIMVVNSNNQHVALYRKVQAQLGAQAEGVPDDYNTSTYYIRTWAAETTSSNQLVTVSRIG